MRKLSEKRKLVCTIYTYNAKKDHGMIDVDIGHKVDGEFFITSLTQQKPLSPIHPS